MKSSERKQRTTEALEKVGELDRASTKIVRFISSIRELADLTNPYKGLPDRSFWKKAISESQGTAYPSGS